VEEVFSTFSASNGYCLKFFTIQNASWCLGGFIKSKKLIEATQILSKGNFMAKGKDKQKSSEKKKPLKTLLEKRKDKKDKKDGSGRSL